MNGLLKEVQKHHTGVIYVPGDPGYYERRNREVVRLHRRGFTTKNIAERVFLTERRVQQILRGAEAATEAGGHG